LVHDLQKTGATLIFATTTPVPPNAVGRVAGSELEYNAAALAIMRQSGVAIDDLHSFAAARASVIQLPHNVHFTPAGSAELATLVAASIRSVLNGNAHAPSRSRP